MRNSFLLTRLMMRGRKKGEGGRGKVMGLRGATERELEREEGRDEGRYGERKGGREMERKGEREEEG